MMRHKTIEVETDADKALYSHGDAYTFDRQSELPPENRTVTEATI